MKFKALIAALAVLVISALPAVAAVPTDVGVFRGQASVGLTGSPCSPTGGGLSLLSGGVNGAQYSINAPGSVTSLGRGGAVGSLSLCGQLDDNATGLGASCATTTGVNGTGTATFPSDTVHLTNLGWPITAGGTFVVTGSAGDGVNPATQTLAAVVQALDNGIVQDCLANNATLFNVVAAYAVV